MGQRAGVAYAAHRNAKMMGFQVDRDPVRREHGLEGINNLFAQAFLHRETPGEESYQACQLGDANNMLMRNVAHVRLAKKVARDVHITRKTG